MIDHIGIAETFPHQEDLIEALLDLLERIGVPTPRIEEITGEAYEAAIRAKGGPDEMLLDLQIAQANQEPGEDRLMNP